MGEHRCFFFFLILMLVSASGCSHLDGAFRTTSAFEEANGYFNRGNYQASLDKYGKIF